MFVKPYESKINNIIIIFHYNYLFDSFCSPGDSVVFATSLLLVLAPTRVSADTSTTYAVLAPNPVTVCDKVTFERRVV